MKADLHVHTDISDGSFGLEATLQEAKTRGITHLAITNHDTIKDLKEAMVLGEALGIKVIPGVEISAYDYENKRCVHILGYNFNLEGKHIRSLCDPILKRRYKKAIWQMQQLAEDGYPIDPIAILGRSQNSQAIYKQHIMADLVDKQCTDKIYSPLYYQLFKYPGICFKEMNYPDVLEAIKAIKAIKTGSGIVILAHPKQSNAYGLVDKLVEAGLDGIELNHESHTEEDYKKIMNFREAYDLILTGGSDFHGDYGASSIQIGDITSPEAFLHFFDEGLLKEKNQLLSFTERIVRELGKNLRENISYPFPLNFKKGNLADIVTEYDVETERFLVEKIKEKYSDHSFITEEETCKEQGFSEYTWIIDPIDGTTNFVSLGKDYAISVALYINQTPYLGVVYDVMKDEMYSAVIKEGAFLNGKKLLSS
ncbi:MAG: PHP domain-containing protein [Clostridiaceae bacterium]|nr:PHP domain-containing protein [Clostridiaceae bacterium]